MVSEIWTSMNPSEILRDVELNKYKTKPKGHGSKWQKMRTDHAISSAVTSTKLLLCCIIQNRKLRRTTTKMRNALLFFENLSTFEFLSFWLSYCT